MSNFELKTGYAAAEYSDPESGQNPVGFSQNTFQPKVWNADVDIPQLMKYWCGFWNVDVDCHLNCTFEKQLKMIFETPIDMQILNVIWNVK